MFFLRVSFINMYFDFWWCSLRLKAIHSHKEPDFNLNDTKLKIAVAAAVRKRELAPACAWCRLQFVAPCSL